MGHVYVYPHISEQTKVIKYPVGGQIKRLFDLSFASLTLLLTIPLIVIVSAAMKAADPGPLLSKQNRVGYRGRRFTCFEFRTAPVGAPARRTALGRDWEGQPVTRSGRFLKQSGVYKLPQLINIIRGDMSLVGPCPILPSDIARYGDRIHLYLSARPGMISISSMNDGTARSPARLAVSDTDYVRDWHFSTDLAVLIRALTAGIDRS
jgi:exopolysaccharide production protein ExoY